MNPFLLLLIPVLALVFRRLLYEPARRTADDYVDVAMVGLAIAAVITVVWGLTEMAT